MADVVGPLTAQLGGPAQAAAQRALDVELGNIRAALSWLCRRRSDDHALRLAAVLWSYWWRSGQCREGATWLRQAIDEYGGDPGRSLAVALLAAGDLANELGDEAVDQLLSRSAQIFEALGDGHGVARARNSLGVAARQRSDLETAERLHQQALDEFRRQADARWSAIARNGLAAVAYCRGDYGLASSIWSDVVAAFRKLGDERSVARYLSNLGNALAASGNDPAAANAYRRALTSARKVGAKDAELSALTNLAGSLYSTNQLDRAVPTLMSALVQARALGHRLNEAAVLGLLGDCDRAQRRSAASADHYLQALDLFHECGDRHDAASCLESLAVLAATNSFADVAVQLYSYASASRRRDGTAPEDDIQAVEAAVNAAAATLTSDELDRHRRTGESKSFDETVRAVRALVESLQTYAPVDGISPLTAREVEVLGELIRRRTDPEIAEKLHISVRTVASHVSSVLRKLEVRSRRDVEAAAERHGLVRQA